MTLVTFDKQSNGRRIEFIIGLLVYGSQRLDYNTCTYSKKSHNKIRITVVTAANKTQQTNTRTRFNGQFSRTNRLRRCYGISDRPGFCRSARGCTVGPGGGNVYRHSAQCEALARSPARMYSKTLFYYRPAVLSVSRQTMSKRCRQ